MNKLISYFIENKIVVNTIIAVLIILGLYSLKNIPREGMPSVNLNQVTINTVYPGASSDDVELNVTIPIEDQLSEVSGIQEMTSVSIENNSSIWIQLDESYSPAEMRDIIDEIREAVDATQDLPEDLLDDPKVKEIKTGDSPIIEIALSHKNRKKLKAMADKLEKKLRKIEEVAGVDKVGYYDKEIHIEVDPKKANEYYFSLPEIVSSIKKRNLRSTSGTLESYTGLKKIVVLNKFQNPTDVSNVILRSNFEQKRIKLSAVAKVFETEKDHKLIVRNNGNYGISILVRKKTNTDIIRTIAKVKKIVGENTGTEIKYDYVNDHSKTTRTRLSLLISNGSIGFVFLVIFLFIFLNKRVAFWTAFGIPLCFIASFAFFSLFGITFSAIALTGLIIVLGIVVDDAIIMAEKTVYYRENGMEAKKAALQAVKDMAVPIITSTLTTIMAYIPMFFLGGRPGKFVQAIPYVVIIILIISLFDAFFLLPNHISHGKTSSIAKKPWMIALENFYEKIAIRILHRRYIFLAAALLVLGSSVFGAKKLLKFQMFPQSNIDTFYIKIAAPKHYSLKQTEKFAKKAEKIVSSLPKKELLSFTTRVGHHSNSKTKNYGDHENWSITNVFLTPDSQRKRTAGKIINSLKKKLKFPKGTSVIIDKKKVGPIGDKPITIHLSSNNEKTLLKAEKKTTKFLKEMKAMGVSEIDSSRKEGKEEIIIDINHPKMASLGISTEDVARTLKIAYDGELVTSLQTLEKKIEYRVLLNEKSRKRADLIKNLSVKNMSGSLVKLGTFISFSSKPSDLEIYRRNGIRSISVTGEVKPKKLTAMEAAKYIEENLIKEWNIPENLDIEIGGEAQKSKEIIKDVGMAVLIAIVFIFFTLAVSLNSWLQPFIIMSAVPFSIIGVIFALIIHGQNISMFILLAIIGLTGVIVNDSIVMVDILNKNPGDKNSSLADKLKQISAMAKTRLRPILLTTITTLSGLMPMAYGLGGYEKMISPLSLAFSWGLLFATLITLFLVPALYAIINDFENK